MTKFVPDALRKAAETYEQRNAQYGDSYKSFGKVMLALFPNGLKYSLLKEEDWNRLAVFIMMAGKLHRYAPNFFEGGHSDSLHDMAIYAMMLDELDQEQKR